jgi:hypothetical protein
VLLLIIDAGYLEHLQEEEGYDEPGSQKDANSAMEFTRGALGIRIPDTETRDEEGGKRQPETSIRGKS